MMNGAGFERRSAAKNADHGKRAACRSMVSPTFFVQAAGQQLAEHDFLLAVAKRRPSRMFSAENSKVLACQP